MLFVERDYISYAETLLPNQYQKAFKTKSLLEIFLYEDKVFTDEIDKLFENAFDVDKATDYQLDILGKLSNLERTSSNDEIYRRDIKIKRALDNSSGTIPEMIDFLRITTNGTECRAFNHFPASVVFTSNGEDTGVATANAVQEVVAAGVKSHGIIHQENGTGFVPVEDIDAYLNYDSFSQTFSEITDSSDPLYYSHFPEIDDVYDEVNTSAGESFMQAGEPLAQASSIVVSVGSDRGILSDIYTEGNPYFTPLTYEKNETYVDGNALGLESVTRINTTNPS